jgi:flagellar basal-body rod protein FlgB
MSLLDSHLGVHAQAIGLRGARAELIARNLANADTPNYKARDIDFRRALSDAAVGRHLPLVATRPGHLSAASATVANTVSGEVQYRVPMAPPLDGNTVDAQVEQAAFADNAVRYQATLNFLSSKFRGLMTAITGQ